MLVQDGYLKIQLLWHGTEFKVRNQQISKLKQFFVVNKQHDGLQLLIVYFCAPGSKKGGDTIGCDVKKKAGTGTWKTKYWKYFSN